MHVLEKLIAYGALPITVSGIIISRPSLDFRSVVCLVNGGMIM